jgi:hypothetical protein
MSMGFKKYFSSILLILVLITSESTAFSAEEQGSGVIDESIRDMSIVLGSGAVGAILGLSTLSFVNSPSKHWKNVAVGGAIGIVFGVAAVVFNQANRSSSSMAKNEIPVNAEKWANLARHEFLEQKIMGDSLETPALSYSFQF